LIKNITKSVYVNVCRGLFEAHKKIFSFLIATSINRNKGVVPESEWGLFLRGPPQTAKPSLNMPNPDPKLISANCWEFLQYLGKQIKGFENVHEDFKNNMSRWENFLFSEDLYNEKISGWDQIEEFKKLLIIRSLRPEQLVFSVVQYVSEQLGKFYEEAATATMDDVFSDSDCKTPVIFILSQGADPSDQLIKFSRDKSMDSTFAPLSLGQGQGRKAEELIERAKKAGSWVLLQNCHLCKSWMPSLEKLVEVLATSPKDEIHKDFRLWLTSMPTEYFPVSVLQNGLKLTTEPPRGLKANLKRSYLEYSQNFVEECQKPKPFRKLLFGLTFFHAILQERRKFGPLGFNIRYEFNTSDLDVSCITLKMFLDLPGEDIPWDAMLYVTGHINYGGRVTDNLDRICLLSILKKYYTSEIFQDDYYFSDSGIYFAPTDGNIDHYRDYIDKLPLNDTPEVFGMHENANITYLTQESNKILDAVLSIQPRVSDSSQEKSTDDIVIDIAKALLKDLPVNMNKDLGNKKMFEANDVGLIPSLSTVLLQEMERFNNLLNVIRNSLDMLQKAIKGFVVMSSELDQMYTAFLNNQLPQNWKKVSYPSLKPLGSWYLDLLERVKFMDNWLMNDNPPAYWLSGFFFPQGSSFG
jgi:dynein heavy chain, axonemal